MLSNKLSVLSLFSGVGAFEKALSNIGVEYDLVGYSEIDKYASKAYSSLHSIPMEENLGDIQKIDSSKLPSDIDMITHGSPCTSFSVAGVQAGGDENSDTPSSLMWNTVKIVENVKPKYVIWENVKNVMSKRHRHNFDRYIDVLEEFGYNSYYQVLNAKEFGVAQNRERVFVISIRKDVDDHSFEFPVGQDTGVRLKDFLLENVDRKYYLSEKVQERFKFRDKEHHSVIGSTAPEFRTIGQRDMVYKEEGTMGALVATDYKQPKQIFVPNKLDMVGLIGDKNSQGNRVYSPEGIASSQVSTAGGLGGKTGLYIEPKAAAIRGRYNEEGKVEQQLEPRKDDNTNTLTTVQKDNVIIERGYEIRRLTPLEGFRLMGFTDEDFNIIKEGLLEEFYKGKDRADTQLYKIAGNSIVVPVLEAIFTNLLKK